MTTIHNFTETLTEYMQVGPDNKTMLSIADEYGHRRPITVKQKQLLDKVIKTFDLKYVDDLSV